MLEAHLPYCSISDYHRNECVALISVGHERKINLYFSTVRVLTSVWISEMKWDEGGGLR
jgi:hypothetical protein